MADTTNLKLSKPVVGAAAWGATLNTLFDKVDTILSKSGTSNPTGFVTPDYINQYYIDTANSKAYVSKGLTTADWVLLNAAGGSPSNVIINGSFNIWQRGSAVTSTGIGTRTYLPDRFFTIANGAALNISRSTAVRTGGKTKYCLEIAGQSNSTTTVSVGQRIESSAIASLLSDGFTVSVWVCNSSADTFAPTFSIQTPTAVDNFASLNTEVVLSPGIDCTTAGGGWTRVYISVSAATVQAYTNIANGMQISLAFPTGKLVAGKTVRVTEFQLQEGTTLSSFLVRSITEDLALCQRFYFKTYEQDTIPGTVSTFKGAIITNNTSTSGATYIEPVFTAFAVVMAKDPTVVIYNASTGAIGTGYNLYQGGPGPIALIVGTGPGLYLDQVALLSKRGVGISEAIYPLRAQHVAYHFVADGEL